MTGCKWIRPAELSTNFTTNGFWGRRWSRKSRAGQLGGTCLDCGN